MLLISEFYGSPIARAQDAQFIVSIIVTRLPFSMSYLQICFRTPYPLPSLDLFCYKKVKCRLRCIMLLACVLEECRMLLMSEFYSFPMGENRRADKRAPNAHFRVPIIVANVLFRVFYLQRVLRTNVLTSDAGRDQESLPHRCICDHI